VVSFARGTHHGVTSSAFVMLEFPINGTGMRRTTASLRTTPMPGGSVTRVSSACRSMRSCTRRSTSSSVSSGWSLRIRMRA
jgi:hypothetical protein